MYGEEVSVVLTREGEGSADGQAYMAGSQFAQLSLFRRNTFPFFFYSFLVSLRVEGSFRGIAIFLPCPQ
jgi:hypothetical protein